MVFCNAVLLDQALVAVIILLWLLYMCRPTCKWLCVFDGSLHNEAKPILFGGKEGAIQWACAVADLAY